MPNLPSALALILVLQGPGTAPVRVDVDGVTGDQRRNIRAHLTIYQRRADPDMPEATLRALHERAPGEVRRALRPFGYYAPTVHGELSRRGSRWVARYRVDSGERVRYAEVDVTLTGAGAEDPVLREVLPLARVQAGEPLRHEAWDRAKQTLLSRAAARGYLDARIIRSRVEVDTVAMAARAVLHVNTGPRYRFGEVRFESTPFEPWLLQRFVTVEPGRYFSLDELLEMQRLLSSSEYFRLVRVEPRREEAEGLRVPIAVGLETRPRTHYTVGAGYGTDTGVRGTASGQRRWLNVRGHRIQGEVRASLRSQLLSARYVIPLRGGPAHRIAATALAQREAFEGLESRTVSARMEWDHGRGGWREVVSLRLMEEWFRGADLSRSSTLLIPEVSWSRVRGEDALYPRRGYRLEIGVSGASDAVVSDVSFGQATAQLSVARGLHPTGRLLLRLNVGATAVAEVQDLPVSLRLYAGGDRSIRGFGYRAVGPRDSTGTVTGGRHRAVGSVELEQQIFGPFAVAVFTDAGNVFDSVGGITFDSLEQGAGFGIRWRSPFGPVRADLAWPVSRPGAGPRIHFAVGGAL